MARRALYPPSVKPGIPKLGKQPKGWVETTFGDVLHVIQRPAEIDDGTEYQLVTARRGRGGIVPRQILTGKKILTKIQYYVAKDDFLISKRQIVHGACGVVPSFLDGAIVSGEYSVLRVNNGILLKYLDYFSHTDYFQMTCFQSSVGVDVEKMIFDLKDWLTVKIYLPPIHEQKKIIDILSKWDKSIALTEKLINEKQNLKKGLIQKLVNGKVRFQKQSQKTKKMTTLFGELPGDFEVKDLGDITDIFFSNVDKLVDKNEQSVFLCNYLDVFNNTYITMGLPFMKATAKQREIEKFKLFKDDVVITKDSETAEDIAKAAVVAEELENVICGYHLAVLRPKKNQIEGTYLMYALSNHEIRSQFIRTANGITRFGLTTDAINNAKIIVPPLQEQSKISNCLKVIDNEINLLKQKHNSLIKQKKGLMQKLLTGQIRVKV